MDEKHSSTFFLPQLPEEERLKIANMLSLKDAEISKLYKEIIDLENKIERFNGGLTWKESENLKTQTAIQAGIVAQVYAGLHNFNLKVVELKDPKSPHAFPIRIEKIPLWTRFSNWIKSLVPWQISKKSAN